MLQYFKLLCLVFQCSLKHSFYSKKEGLATCLYASKVFNIISVEIFMSIFLSCKLSNKCSDHLFSTVFSPWNTESRRLLGHCCRILKVSSLTVCWTSWIPNITIEKTEENKMRHLWLEQGFDIDLDRHKPFLSLIFASSLYFILSTILSFSQNHMNQKNIKTHAKVHGFIWKCFYPGF